MKLLFDENLSHKLVRLLADLFPDSVHVRDVGLKAADDSEVWKYAQDNSSLICSKDSDGTDCGSSASNKAHVVWKIRLSVRPQMRSVAA